MDCRQAQEEILEMFDGSPAAEVSAHLAGCAACTAFLAQQSALDRELATMFGEAPQLSSTFRAELRGRIREESPKLWPEALPDIVHVGSCLAVTGLCAAVLPFSAGPVLAIGATVTGATYCLILATRLWLDA
jgi:anti-sigma factor RsiW